nr:DUF1156 domain-containing protein [Tepidiphilus baoligensis]
MLQNTPALIKTVFPAQRVSFEAQKEREAVAAQTLTELGSYWTGRKPLILVRAIVLGSLLPSTDDAEANLAVFKKLMCGWMRKSAPFLRQATSRLHAVRFASTSCPPD